ncbi:MAG: GNAT family N-acetyltransferase [Armatimonadota bacterium]
MDSSILLKTQRLTLRRFIQNDLDELFFQLSDPDVMRYYPATLSREECEKWLEGILRDYQTNGFGMLAVHMMDTGEYVGQAGVMRRQKDGGEHYYLSYLMCRKFWGQGYAIEAARAIMDYSFRTLNVPKIEALIMPDNKRSIRLVEKLGMKRESSIEHNGSEHYIYALTQQQY